MQDIVPELKSRDTIATSSKFLEVKPLIKPTIQFRDVMRHTSIIEQEKSIMEEIEDVLINLRKENVQEN
jgi:hypothetical protein